LSKGGDLLFVGDVHLDREDPALGAFLEFLERRGAEASRIVLLGDLFNLWIGRRELEQAHQRAVLDQLARLRQRGVVVRYIEGNRDFHIGPAYTGGALDDASDGGIEEVSGGRRIFVIHGDLANTRDVQYRSWRRISRSAPFWALFNALPAARRLRLAESIETRMRRSNLDFKREFPEQAVRRYAARFLANGYDAVVLGHFHVEKKLEARHPSPPGKIFVLPEWRTSRRYLRASATGDLRFETF
jgi:UDP-2,3-diacylglucosamine hydrolase